MIPIVEFLIGLENKIFKRWIQKALYYVRENRIHQFKQTVLSRLHSYCPFLLGLDTDELDLLDNQVKEDIDIFIRHCQKFLSLLVDMDSYGSTHQLQILDACFRFKQSAGKGEMKCVTYPNLIQEIILFDMDHIIVQEDSDPIPEKWIYILDRKHLLFSEQFTIELLKLISF